MRRLCNIALTVAVALTLAGPMIVLAFERAQIELPSWATAESAKYLAGGITDANVADNLTLRGVTSGNLQESINNEIDNRIPFRASVMLANAALQRRIIALANIPKEYPAYPTYFGSTRLFIPSENAVTYMPYKRSQANLYSVQQFGEQLSLLAKRYPDKRFVVCLVQGYQEPAANPAYSLMTNPVAPQEYAQVLSDALSATTNTFVTSQGYSTIEEYYQDYFKTDHHWNHKGIERAYNSLAELLELQHFDNQEEIPFENYRFCGATARGGLDLVFEPVFDTSHDFSQLLVESPDGSTQPYGHQSFSGNANSPEIYTFYDSYYSIMKSGSILRSSGKDKKACIVSNSFGKGLAPYLAENYSSIYLSQSLHPSISENETSETLEALIAEHSFDDIIFIANPTDIAKFEKNMPSFLS